ncbi:MAG: hypothetical protein ACREHG_05530 [Candidatus Saccharimonadales bacterium]
MSTYVDKAINPKTNKNQSAIFIDDFYGRHLYGVAFRKDGTDTAFDDIRERIVLEDYEVYPLQQIQTASPNGVSDHSKTRYRKP